MLIDMVFLTALLPAAPPPVVPETSAPFAEETKAPKEVPMGWTGSVSIGASYSDGNTDSRSVNATAEAENRTEKGRWTAKGYWNYAEDRDATTGEFGITQRRAGASLKYDRFLSKKFYVNALAATETDTLADISLRWYAGAGVGYQWREDDKLKWASEVGVTYFDTDYNNSDDKNYPAARLANILAWHITDKTSFENTVEAFPSLEDSADFYGKSDTKLKTNLTDKMFAQLQWLYQYTAIPADGAERTDNLLVLGVGWGF